LHQDVSGHVEIYLQAWASEGGAGGPNPPGFWKF